VDASTFALWIHHNIPQFCNDVEQLAAIMDDFGAADLMRTDEDIVSFIVTHGGVLLTVLVAV